jgi:hypothetical protein
MMGVVGVVHDVEEIGGLLGRCTVWFGVWMAIVKSEMGWMLGPCGEPAMRVDGEEIGIRAGVIAAAAGSETSGRMGHGRESRSGSDGRIVGLIGAIGAAEILAHLLKSEPALGDVGRAEPASSIALDKTLGEEKVCDAFSPDLDVLLGLWGWEVVRVRERGRAGLGWERLAYS